MKISTLFNLILLIVTLSSCGTNENQWPVAEIISPSADTTIECGNKVKVMVYASDPDGEIAYVMFFVNDLLYSIEREAPWDYLFTFGTTGTFTIQAKAYDNEDYGTLAIPRVITVYDLGIPSVELHCYPTYLHEFESVNFEVDASTTVGTIEKVSLFVDASLFMQDTTEPFEFVWDSVPGGVYAIYATGESSEGVTGFSDTLEVKSIPNGIPTVQITWPAEGASFRLGAVIPIQLGLGDPEGYIVKSEIFADGTLLTTLQGFNSFYDWDSPPSGVHTLSAITYDSKGAMGYSEEATFTVLNGIFSPGIVSDLAYSEDEDLVFGITASPGELLLISPSTLSLTEFQLPFEEPIAMDYALEDKNLYIIYASTGKISVFNKPSQEISLITFSETAHGLDIRVDELNRRIYVLTSLGFYILDMDDGSILLENGEMSGNIMDYDRESRLVFTLTQGYILSSLDKYSVIGDSLELLQSDPEHNTLGHVEISPNSQYFVIPGGAGNGNNYKSFAFDTEDITHVVAEYFIGYAPLFCTFSPDGQALYGCNNDSQDPYLYKVNAVTFEQMGTMPLPKGERYVRMTTNLSNTKLIVFHHYAVNDNDYIIFVYDL